MTAVEVCPICDIAGCRHIRERKAQMTHPTDAELDALVGLTRFDLEQAESHMGSASMSQQDYGDWVRYDDASSAITALRAHLAAANARADRAEAEISRLTDLNSTAYIDGHDAAKNEYRDEIRRLEVLNAQLTVMVGEDAVEQIEAERAAQIEVDAGILQAVADNWDCGHSDSRYCRCAELAEQWCIAADEIRNQPHDRSALDAVRRAAKVEAWKEAEVATLGLATGHGCRTAILALIEGWGKS